MYLGNCNSLLSERSLLEPGFVAAKIWQRLFLPGQGRWDQEGILLTVWV